MRGSPSDPREWGRSGRGRGGGGGTTTQCPKPRILQAVDKPTLSPASTAGTRRVVRQKARLRVERTENAVATQCTCLGGGHVQGHPHGLRCCHQGVEATTGGHWVPAQHGIPRKCLHDLLRNSNVGQQHELFHLASHEGSGERGRGGSRGGGGGGGGTRTRGWGTGVVSV